MTRRRKQRSKARQSGKGVHLAPLHFTNGKIALRIFKRGGRVFAHRSDGDKREVLTAAQWDALEESWKRNDEPIDPHCCFTYYQLVAVGYPSNLEQLVRAQIDFAPRAYAQGFEAGAYALAAVVTEKLKSGDLQGLVTLMGRYEQGAAHPARGWDQESVRG